MRLNEKDSPKAARKCQLCDFLRLFLPDFIPYLYAPESLLRGPENTFLRFFMGWIIAFQNAENVEISMKKRPEKVSDFLAEDTGLEPAGLLHLTRFPGELLSHSVNPPYLLL